MDCPSTLVENARDLDLDLAWLRRILEFRFKVHFAEDSAPDNILAITPPELGVSSSPYAEFLRRHAFPFVERLAIVLALAPHLRPRMLDVLFTRNSAIDRRFTEFGGDASKSEGGFMPSGETLVFLLGGDDLVQRFQVERLFAPEHAFAKSGLLRLGDGQGTTDSTPFLRSPLRISEDLLSLLTLGRKRIRDYGVGFPARRIETKLEFRDLVLHPTTRRNIEEIQVWIEHGDALMQEWGMAAKLRPGYRSLFYGPPGTGKTMTACLLGKSTGREVYKVDISLVVSKYIGETEKNLGRLFDQAENQGWILFFDEADALFGKRSETKDAHDRYANQEIAFLLQRMEVFDGISILASNLRGNLDDAFARRFESVIYFPMPRPEERMKLWQQGFPPKIKFDASIDLAVISREHALSGGAIMNVIRQVSLQSLKEGRRPLTQDDLLLSIRREYTKEAKSG